MTSNIGATVKSIAKNTWSLGGYLKSPFTSRNHTAALQPDDGSFTLEESPLNASSEIGVEEEPKIAQSPKMVLESSGINDSSERPKYQKLSDNYTNLQSRLTIAKTADLDILRLLDNYVNWPLIVAYLSSRMRSATCTSPRNKSTSCWSAIENST